MSKNKQQNSNRGATLPPWLRVILAFFFPILGSLLAGALASSFVGAASANAQATTAPLLGGLGLVSWFIGVRWYGISGMGLRGKRPLFASIGFATLGWVAFLVLRFIFVIIIGFGPANSGRQYFYLLLFESFAVQLWVFGLLFRSLADWRGGLTAAITSGIIFGAVAYLFFQESFTTTLSSLLYFILWGVLFGIIRLRSGSLLGGAVVQSLHSFTAWVVIAPQPQPAIDQLQSLYLASSVAYLIIIWRLWPKTVADYRV